MSKLMLNTVIKKVKTTDDVMFRENRKIKIETVTCKYRSIYIT